MNQSFPLSSIFPSNSTPATALAWNWVVETLAEIKEIDTRILQVPIATVPIFLSHSSEAAREKIALKYLEEWLEPQWAGPPLPDAPELLDANKSSEEVLSLLLEKATASDILVTDGVELFKHELRLFILKKRATLPKRSVNVLEASNSGLSKSISLFKRKDLMCGLDPCAHRESECGKTGWKEVLSGYREQLAKLSQKVLESPEQISSASAAKNATVTMQEDPYRPGQQSPQRDGAQLHSLKQLPPPVPPATDNIKEVLQENPSGSGRLSNQKTSEECKLLRKDSVSPAADICGTIMQEDPSACGELFGQQIGEKNQLSTHVSSARPADIGNGILQEHPLRPEHQLTEQNDSFKLLLQNIATAHVTGSGIVNLQENCKGAEQLFPQHSEPQLLEQISAAKAAERKESLQEYTRGPEEQHLEENASYCGSREPSNGQSVRTDCDISHAIEPKLVSVPHSNRNEVVLANSDSRVEDLKVSRSMATDAEPNISKAPSDKDRWQGPSLIIDRKVGMFSDEKLGGSHILLKAKDSVENGICLKCDKGGSLLICSTGNCDVAFHQQCIDSVIDFDEKGNFYCPLCSYSQAALVYYRAKKKYSRAKRAVASLFGKESVGRHQRILQPGAREKGQVRRDGNMKCHEQIESEKEISKRVGKEMGASIRCDNRRRQRVAEAFDCANRNQISCKVGEIDSGKPIDDYQVKQTCADMLVDNGKFPCSGFRVNVDLPPLKLLSLRILKDESVSGKTAALTKLQQSLNDEELSESCNSMKHIPEDKGVPRSINLAREQGDKTLNVALANGKSLNCEAVFPRTCVDMQQKSQQRVEIATEQNIDNLQNGVSSYIISGSSPKRRKTDLQMSNKMGDGCQGPQLVNQHLMEANAINDSGKLTCEKGETSRLTERDALYASNMNRETTLNGDMSDIQNQQHRDIHVTGHDIHNSLGEAAGTPAAVSSYGCEKRRVLFSTVHNHQLSNKRRNYWSPEEEEALKGAMETVALENGNVPWSKIWGKIRHILGEARQPSDLRLKWRNIMIKEARARKAVD